MPRKITEVGLQFREKFGYTGKIAKEAMGKELWNEWCKLAMKKRRTTPEHKKAAGRLKNVLATYNDAEDLINIGAYRAGSNKEIDYAINKINSVNNFLRQDVNEKFMFEDEINMLKDIF